MTETPVESRPATPGGRIQVPVSGQFVKADGSPRAGAKIVFRPLLSERRKNICTSTDPVVVYTDDAGEFRVMLTPSDDPAWTDGILTVPYIVDVFLAEQKLRHRVWILASGMPLDGWTLTDLIENWSMPD